VRTVNYVDLQKYMGQWYEIASYPQSFQKGCVKSQAFYSLREDGKVDVLNSCVLENGKIKEAKGKGKVVDTVTNSKLKVSFFWPFYGDYWIINLGADYEFAVVANPARDAMWILARSPEMKEEVYQNILRGLEEQKFSLDPIKVTGKLVP
jgi:apolipoprotein D and lipocalin family protein